MDNQVDISNSYFINKSRIRDKNKRKHETIKKFETCKTLIISDVGNSMDRQEINEIFDNEIKKRQDKISKNTLPYSY